MAAFSFESQNLAFQRVKIATANANPGIVRMFKELKAHMAQVKGHPDMQFLPFTDANTVNAGGTVLATGVAKLIAAYVKKDGTSGTGTATDAVVKLMDDATDDTGTADVVAALVLLAADDQRVYVDPQGMPLAAGLVVTAHTGGLGSTDSTAGDVGNGFALVANF